MRIRVFTAPRMAEAMAMVRSELGADAVILGNRRMAGGVEVTAALESPEPAVAPPVVPPSAAPPGRAASVLARHGVPSQLAAHLEGDGPLAASLARRLGFALLPDAALRPILLAGPC